MPELIQHLCQKIAEQLQAQPQMPTADLVTAALAQIAGDDQLLQSSRQVVVTAIQGMGGDIITEIN